MLIDLCDRQDSNRNCDNVVAWKADVLMDNDAIDDAINVKVRMMLMSNAGRCGSSFYDGKALHNGEFLSKWKDYVKGSSLSLRTKHGPFF